MLGNHFSRRSAFLACALSLVVAGEARANLLINGSFESGPNPGASLAIAPGSTVIPGWVATRAGVDYVGTLWTAAQGFRSVALNGPAAGGIAQTFATLPNARYNVRFYLAGDAETLPDIKTMGVSAAGQSGNFTADITGMWAWDPGWNPNLWSFRANSLSTTIEFYSTMTGTTGPTIDSVSVELVSTADAPATPQAGLFLAPAFPNPSHGARRMRFGLPAAAHARVGVFDLAGREVAVLLDASLPEGAHEAVWDGRVNGAPALPGLYHVRLSAGDRQESRSLVVVR